MPKTKFTLAPPTEQDLVRFHSKYICGLTPDDCYEWIAGTRSGGYGVMHWFDTNGKSHSVYVHRIAYFLHHGVDPGEFFALHSCDNPKCPNGRHIFLGTHDDNMADKTRKRRQSHGSKHGRALITEEDVLYMRKRLKEEGWKIRPLAKELTARFPMLSFGSIRQILRGKTWKHVTVE